MLSITWARYNFRYYSRSCTFIGSRHEATYARVYLWTYKYTSLNAKNRQSARRTRIKLSIGEKIKSNSFPQLYDMIFMKRLLRAKCSKYLLHISNIKWDNPLHAPRRRPVILIAEVLLTVKRRASAFVCKGNAGNVIVTCAQSRTVAINRWM